MFILSTNTCTCSSFVFITLAAISLLASSVHARSAPLHPCTFIHISDTSNSEALSVAAFSCVGTPDSDSQSHPQEGHLQWMFASGSLLLSINTATSTSLNNRKEVCVQFEEGSSPVVPLLVDSHRMRSRGQVVCKQVGPTGRVSFLLESNFKPFDARHIFLRYRIQHN